MTIIRHAQAGDARAIAGIWNPVIRDTIVTFNPVEKSETDVAALIAARPGAFWLAEDGAALGFATFAQFRDGPGYAQAMEHTIILAASARGRGIGRLLMEVLVAGARARGVHVLIGAVSGENAEAIAFHSAMGFAEAGRLPGVGCKFGRRLDLVLMLRTL